MAVTRAKQQLEIPDTLLPEKFATSAAVKKIIADKSNKSSYKEKFKKPAPKMIRKVYNHTESGSDYASAYEPWTPALDAELTELFRDGASLIRMSAQLGRSKGAVWSRIKKLKLREME